jgi:hypothetical protein
MNEKYEPARNKLDRNHMPMGKLLDSLLTDCKIASMPGFVGTVGTTSVVVLNGNSKRVYALVVNDSLQDVWLGFGEPATQNQGIRLNSEGGNFELTWKNLFTGTISAISKSENVNVIGVDGYGH